MLPRGLAAAGGSRAEQVLLLVSSLQTWIEQSVLLILKNAPFDKWDAPLQSHLTVIYEELNRSRETDGGRVN